MPVYDAPSQPCETPEFSHARPNSGDKIANRGSPISSSFGYIFPMNLLRYLTYSDWKSWYSGTDSTSTSTLLNGESPQQLPSLRELLLKIEASFDEEQRQLQSSGLPMRPPAFFRRSLSDAAPLCGIPSLPIPSRGPSSFTTAASGSWIERHPLYKAFQEEDPMANLRPASSIPFKAQVQDSTKGYEDEDSDPSESTMRSQTSNSSLSPSISISSSSHSSSSSTLKKRETPRRYLCTVCDKTFTRPSTLKTHMNSVRT